MSFRTVVLTGGDPVPSALRHRIHRPDLVVAADSGYRLAQLLGLRVDLVVGDLDSLDPSTDLAETEIERHPPDKNHSDMELAFLAARARGSTELVVVGGKGGRLDHLLVNAALIAACDWASVVWMTGSEIAYVVRRLLTIDGRAGDLLTLIAWGGDAHGVTTEGLRFPLSSETLAFGTARGLSNVMLEPRAKVSLSSGVVLAIHLPASDPLS